MTHPIWTRPAIIAWSQLLLDSFRHWIGRDLLERKGSSEQQAQALFDAPFVVISHGIESEPILNYGNRAALQLWEMTWERLTRTPSRHTAEAEIREERGRMLALAEEQGCYVGYRGVRVSATGRRFLVMDATVWNVLNQNKRVGQAATFSRWASAP
jgi:hypothetical protein